ncbi:7320_t:CDS:2, partial [Acaulospora morrowiae]
MTQIITQEESSVARAEEPEASEEPEEHEEIEDQKPAIEEECGSTPACSPLKHHLEECARRVESGDTEEN